MNKITIIGAGRVGATIAYTLTVNGSASEIILIDIDKERALGEALDIRQGTPFCGFCSIRAGEYEDAVGSDIVIITSGVARKPGQSRLDLAQTNINIIKSIAPQITKYAPDATYIIVSNPVDILTYVFTKVSGIPESRVMGTGTVLDTARLRSYLAAYYSINQQNIHAYVLGEHGDSAFVPWSIANISNIPMKEAHDVVCKAQGAVAKLDYEAVEEHVRKSGAYIIQRKGATFNAIAVSTCHICRCLSAGIDTTLTVSTMLHGEYGIDDVCLSLLNVIGKGETHGKVLLPLQDDELEKLHKSAQSLKDVINSVKI